MVVNSYVLAMQKIATFYQILAHAGSKFESIKAWPLTTAHWEGKKIKSISPNLSTW